MPFRLLQKLNKLMENLAEKLHIPIVRESEYHVNSYELGIMNNEKSGYPKRNNFCSILLYYEKKMYPNLTW